MAINRYDTPAQAQFINTYVPIPFDQIMKVGLMKQQQVEKNDVGAAELTAALNSFQVAPFDQKGLEEVTSEYNSKLSDVLSNSKPGSYETTKGLINLRAQMSADPRLKDMKYNYEQYGNHVKNMEAARENNAEGPNSYGMDYALRDITEKGGAVGLIKQGLSGKWSPGGWSKPVDTYESVQKYVDNVDASSIERESSTGKWILNKKESGKELSTLVDQFGLAFEKAPAKEGNFYKTVIKNKDLFESNLVNKDWGRQYLKNARYALGKDPNSMDKDVIELASEYAKNEMVTAAKERVSKNSSETIQIDPEWMAGYNERIKNFKQALGWESNGILKGEEVSDVTGLSEAITSAESVLSDAQESYDKTKSTLTSLPIQGKDSEGNPTVIGYEYIDPVTKKDYTDVMRKREAAVDAAHKEIDHLKGIERQVRKETADKLKVSPDYEPPIELKKKAARRALTRGPAAASIGVDAIIKLFETSHGDFNSIGELPEDVKNTLNKYYNKELGRIDPFYAEMNRNLEERHKDKVVPTRISNFTDDRSNKAMEEGFMNHGTSNSTGLLDGGTLSMTNAKTGEPYDYTKIHNALPVKYLGWDINPNSGEVQAHYIPQTNKSTKEKPVYGDELTIRPPSGFVNLLLNEGQTNDAELFLANQLSNNNLASGETITIPIKDKNGVDHKVSITKFSDQEIRKHKLGADETYKFEMMETSAAVPGMNNITVASGNKNKVISEILNYYSKLNASE